MKRIKKILSIAVFVFLVVFLGLSAFVAFKGKGIALDMVQKSLNRKVEVGAIRVSLPFSITLDNLAIENLITARRVTLTPSIIGFLSGKIALNQINILNPQFFLTRQEDGSWNLLVSKEKSNLAIAGLVINNGTLNFLDKKINPSGFNFKVQNIYLNVHTSVISLRPLSVVFNLKADVPSSGNKEPGNISANGWVNWIAKDMKGKIELSGLDALQLLPYYENYLPSPMKSGWISFTSDLNAKSNNLIAVCHLSVKDLIFEKKEGEKNPGFSILDIVTGGLKNENQEVSLDFTVNTKLDRPRVDVARLTGSVVAKSLGEQMINNPQGTIEKFKGIGKDFESFGKDFLKNKAGDSK